MSSPTSHGAITARSVVVQAEGDSGVLKVEERSVAVPGRGEVRVKVSAGGVNFIDIYQRNGTHDMNFPFVAGMEGAGVVESVGDDVAHVQIGDRVAWASVPGSGYTTHAVLGAGAAVPIPAGVTDEDAAAVLLQGLTAHYLGTSTYPVAAGETVLVHAGAGGVGLLLTQLLKHRGVRVLTTVSTSEKAALSREAGAAEVIRYDEVNFADEVLRLTDGAGLPVVYDGVGRATYEDSMRCLAPRGTLALFGAASGPVPPIDPRELELGGSLFLTRPTLRHYIATPEELRERVSEIFALMASGDLQVRIGGRYSLEEAAQAQDDLAARRSTGKLLIIPSEEIS
ncbi:MAG TPA: quinone oxidoreductase [Actinomycetales bacterium]|nr:quinone oxidoreductase [Actinomycetales bacterium]